MQPGSMPVSNWGHTYLFPSSGPGVYSLRFFSNTSANVTIAQPFLKHGAVRAVHRFRLTESASCATAQPGMDAAESTLPTVLSQDCLPADSGWLQNDQGLVCGMGTFSRSPPHLEIFSLTLLPASFNYSRSKVLADQVYFPWYVPQHKATHTGSWSPCQVCAPGSFSDRPGSSGCWPCPDPEIAPLHGSSHCQSLPQFSGNAIVPQHCPTEVAGCIQGSECWQCLSRCCDPCHEFLQRPRDIKYEAQCAFEHFVFNDTYDPASIQRPPPPKDMVSETTAPQDIIDEVLTTTIQPTTTSRPILETTPIPRECGNARRLQRQSKCHTTAFGSTLVMPCNVLEQEIEDGLLLLGSDGRWHVTEECDDGNVFNGDFMNTYTNKRGSDLSRDNFLLACGFKHELIESLDELIDNSNDIYIQYLSFHAGDGCSSECTIEEGFVCKPSSHSSRSRAGGASNGSQEHRLRALRGDFCIPQQPQGLMGLLASKGSLDGWANIAHVNRRDEAGWMRFSLQPYNHDYGELATTHWGAIFLRETEQQEHVNQQRHELWNCACDSEFQIIRSWNGSYSALQGSVSHDLFTCSFRIDPPGSSSVLISLDLTLLAGEKIEVWDAEWRGLCMPCVFEGSVHAGKNSITVATPATIHIIAAGTRQMQDVSYLQYRAKIFFEASEHAAEFQITYGLRNADAFIGPQNQDQSETQPSNANDAFASEQQDRRRSADGAEILRVAIGAGGAPACDFKPYNSIRPSNYLKMRRVLAPSSAVSTWNIDGAWEGETRAEVMRKLIGGVENGRCAVKLVIQVPFIRLHVYGCRRANSNSKEEVLRGSGGICIRACFGFHC